MSLYFIALVPNEEINKKVKGMKEEMAEKFEASHALKLPAHITLQPPFKLNEKEEDLLLKELNRVSGNFSPFELELSGFGSFSSRVIFVKIKDPQPVQNIYNELQKELRMFLPGESPVTGDFHPHITIATKDLDQAIYPNAWKEFRQREFSAKFPVNKLFLFRHEGKGWRIIKEFNFSLIET